MFTFLTCVLKDFFKMNKHNFNKLRPLIVVLGATGTGKSKLAIELASKYGGEVISADSMQIYKGLDIVTNKVTKEEQQLVPHHLISFLDPIHQYTVVDFQQDSLRIIKNLHNAGKIPVIVGGTHYYIESILWNILIGSSESLGDDCKISISGGSNKNISSASDKSSHGNNISNVNVASEYVTRVINSEFDPYLHLSNEELHQNLGKVDPDYASMLHPNNRRKILRALEVWEKTGRRHSEVLANMRQVEGGDTFGGGKRFTNVALLWLTCQKDTLKQRLDSRVEEMISAGLLDELENFHERFNAPLVKVSNSHPDGEKEEENKDHYKKGIFQSIGFKEFHKYLMLPPKERDTPQGKKLYKQGLDLMKQRTHNYSKRQLRWIRNRLLIRDRKAFPLYHLDTSDPSKWEDCVSKPAEQIVSSMLEERESPVAPVTVVNKDPEIVSSNKTRHFCDTCQRIFIGDVQMKAHLQSAKHRNMCKKRKLKEEQTSLEVQ